MFVTRQIHRPLALAAVAFLAAAPLSAQQTDTAETDIVAAEEAGMGPEFVRAYDVAMARINQTLSHDEVAQINLLAYASAASGLCADLELDEAAVYGALTSAAHDSLDGAGEDDAQLHKDFSLIAFGVITGLILENAAADEAGFCAEAVQYSTDMGTDAFLKQVGASEPQASDN